MRIIETLDDLEQMVLETTELNRPEEKAEPPKPDFGELTELDKSYLKLVSDSSKQSNYRKSDFQDLMEQLISKAENDPKAGERIRYHLEVLLQKSAKNPMVKLSRFVALVGSNPEYLYICIESKSGNGFSAWLLRIGQLVSERNLTIVDRKFRYASDEEIKTAFVHIRQFAAYKANPKKITETYLNMFE